MTISMGWIKDWKLMSAEPVALGGTRCRDSINKPAPAPIAVTDFINWDFGIGRERAFSQVSTAESDVKPYNADCRIAYPEASPAPIETLALIRIGTASDNMANTTDPGVTDKKGKVIWRTVCKGVSGTTQATYMNGYFKMRPANNNGGRALVDYRSVGSKNGMERMGYHWLAYPDGYLQGARIELTSYLELTPGNDRWRSLSQSVVKSNLQNWPHIIVCCSAWTPSGTANGTTYDFAEARFESTFSGGNP